MQVYKLENIFQFKFKNIVILSLSLIIFYAVLDGFFNGWTTARNYVPFLPSGYQIFKAYPYSLIVFSTVAIIMFNKLGLSGLGLIGVEEALWELTFFISPQLISALANNWLYWFIFNIDNLVFWYIVTSMFARKNILNYNITIIQLAIFSPYAIAVGTQTYAQEFIGEILFFIIFLVLSPYYLPKIKSQ